MKKLPLCICFSLLFAACDKQNMPHNDGAEIEKESIIGTWSVNRTAAYLRVSDAYQSFSSMLEGKLEDKLDKEALRKTLMFTEEQVYCIGEYSKDSSLYYINKDTLYLTNNPNLIGFYAPYFYLKRKNSNNFNQIIAYLGKKESLNLLEEDGSIGSYYMKLIKNNVKQVQCELHFDKED
jgi:hypothetical protein